MELPPFQRLIDAHARDVHRFLVASVGAGDADDVYQDTWVAALGAYPRLRHGENLRAWLFTIAQRKALDLLRARGRHGVAAGDHLPDVPDPAPEPGDDLPDPALWSQVAALAPKQRTALALRVVLDADYATVAAMMGTSEAAARRNVHAALTHLRREDLHVRPA